MINNKNELIAFMDKYGIVPVTPVVTIKKGYICTFGSVPQIQSAGVYCHYDDLFEVKGIINDYKKNLDKTKRKIS